MKLKKLLCILMMLMAFSAVQAAVVYDYDNGELVDSDGGGTSIEGQDGWVIITPGQTVRGDFGDWAGLSGLVGSVGGDGQASRVNGGKFNYAIVGDNITIEYTSRLSSSNGVTLALGADADGNGNISSGEVAFQLGHHQNASIGFYIRESAFGGNIASGVRAGSTGVWRIVLDVDLAANSGDGAGTLSVQKLSDGSGNPVEDTLTQVASGNLKIGRMIEEVRDPSTWSGLYTRMYNSSIDNLTIRGDVAAPHATAVSPDRWENYAPFHFESLDAVLSWNTGRDPSSWADPNSNVIAHHVYIRDTDSTDPNMILAQIVPVGTDPASWDPSGDFELARGKVYQWAVVELLTDRGEQVGDLSRDLDPNNTMSPIWTFKTEPAVPIIVAQPESQFVALGNTATFSVGATDPMGGTLSYLWTNSAGEEVGTESSLMIADVQLINEDSFTCVVSNGPGSSTTSDTVSLTAGRLIGNWLADGTLVDATENGNDGTAFNNPLVVDGPMEGTFALQFDGATQYATVTIDEVLNKYDDQYTIAFWVRDEGAATWRRFLNYGYYNINGGSFARADICRNNWGTRTLAVRSHLTGSTFETASMPQDEWNHFVVVYGEAGLHLYKNGLLASAPTAASGKLRSVLDEPIVFGARIYVANDVATPASSHFKGSLSDVRVYNYGMDDLDVLTMYTTITGTSVCFDRPDYDISGPDGEPDCIVNLYDFVQISSDWMLSNQVSPSEN